MAKNKIGEAYVEISAENKGLKAKLKESENATRDSAKKAEKSFDDNLKVGERLQSVFSKLLIPAAIATSVAGIVQQFKGLIQEAAGFRRELEKSSRESERLLQATAARARGQENADAEITQGINDQVAALNAQADQLIENDNLLKQVQRGVASLFSDEPVTVGEKQAAIAERINEIYKDGNRLIETERDIRAKAEAERARSLTQQLEDENKLREAQLLRRGDAERDLFDAAGIEAEVEIGRVRRLLAEEENAEVRRGLRERIALITEARDAEIAAIQEASRERAAAEQKAREDRARSHAEAMRQAEELAKAVDDLSVSISDMLNVNGTSGLGAGLADLNNSLRALTLQPRQGGGPL